VNSFDAVFQEYRAGRVYDGFAAERRLRQLLRGYVLVLTWPACCGTVRAL